MAQKQLPRPVEKGVKFAAGAEPTTTTTTTTTTSIDDDHPPASTTTSTTSSAAAAPPTRPAAPQHSDSVESLHPGLKPEVLNVPVTPGIELGAYSPEQTTNGGGGGGTLSRPASGYFHAKGPLPGATTTTTRSGDGEGGDGGEGDGDMVQAGQELLRRLSMTQSAQKRPTWPEADPVQAHPALGLSGGIISATFAIPYALEYRRGADWGMESRRGTSALFDSFRYLASDRSPWRHTLVGWTGEIATGDEGPPSPHDEDPAPGHSTASRARPLNKNSAPIPVDGAAPEPQADGLTISREDRLKLEQHLRHDAMGRIVPVWLADEDDQQRGGSTSNLGLKDQSRWRRFAERTLYTLFHYKQNEPDDGRAERKSWADYYRMNQQFADRILDIYKPGDIVMIHDYHLFLLPSLLRQRVPHMYIAFFLHVPFPSSEFMRCVPQRKEILEGVLGANLCGFQSYSYSRHFVSCCTRITGFESDVTGVNAFGAKVMVGVFPIGIDVDVVERDAFSKQVDEKLLALKKLYGGTRLIVGRDRLDSVRGVSQKLQAFERFLELYPEWRGKVVLIQVTSPTSLEAEREEGRDKVAIKVAEIVQNINGLYGSLKHTPVQHYPQYLAEDEYFALLRAGDIGLITSVRDGMNTTSLEYILCQRDGHGPLILSEFSGTAGSLRNAIHINPWDLTGVARQLHAALTMDDERKARMHRSLYDHVTTRNVRTWCSSFIKRLLTVLGSHTNQAATPLLDTAALVTRYRAASRRLFMFDYDGTLTPIVDEPSNALPSDRLIRTLTALATDPRNNIWVISGRDQEFLTRHLGFIEGIGFSAEHGSFLREPRATDWQNLAEQYDMSWQETVQQIFQKYTDATPGAYLERKKCALTWHYRAADPEQGADSARACQRELLDTVARQHDVEIMTGKANLEVRPTFINKGNIASRLLAAYGPAGPPPDFALCLGDDFTDEDMFRALNASRLPAAHSFPCVVGASSKMTLARWHLLEPADVVHTLGLLDEGEGSGEAEPSGGGKGVRGAGGWRLEA